MKPTASLEHAKERCSAESESGAAGDEYMNASKNTDRILLLDDIAKLQKISRRRICKGEYWRRI
jgi:bacterioferritin (cytochrome b1)